MNAQQKLLKALDHALGLPDAVESKINRIRRAFDRSKNEHVFLVEYTVRVNGGGIPQVSGDDQGSPLWDRLTMVEWNPRVRS